jgi:uncharacterized protein (DUF934 family)
MNVIKDREVILNVWQYDFLDNSSTPGPHDIISYQRWLVLPPVERSRVQAIALQPEDELNFSHAEVFELKVIAMVFPNFHEGRGYTQATLLRQRGFSGEIRAIGAYRDNLILLEQCGFDSFDLVESEDLFQALYAFSELSVARVCQ